MKPTPALGLLVLAVLMAVFAYAFTHNSTDPGSGSVSSGDQGTVEALVTEFGTKLKMVSLLAPASERKAAMDAAYSAYVSPELLASWYPEGSNALGRQTSSPWPDHLNIVGINLEVNNTYVVNANILEMATIEGTTTPSLVAVQPVSFTVKKVDGAYKIVAASKGAYSEIPHQQTIVGNWECLPHKNTSGAQTTECAFGIAVENSDGHYAVNTSLMAQYPVDFPTGTKVRVTGIVMPANQLSSVQKYDIDGIINATVIQKI